MCKDATKEAAPELLQCFMNMGSILIWCVANFGVAFLFGGQVVLDDEPVKLLWCNRQTWSEFQPRTRTGLVALNCEPCRRKKKGSVAATGGCKSILSQNIHFLEYSVFKYSFSIFLMDFRFETRISNFASRPHLDSELSTNNTSRWPWRWGMAGRTGRGCSRFMSFQSLGKKHPLNKNWAWATVLKFCPSKKTNDFVPPIHPPTFEFRKVAATEDLRLGESWEVFSCGSFTSRVGFNEGGRFRFCQVALPCIGVGSYQRLFFGTCCGGDAYRVAI